MDDLVGTAPDETAISRLELYRGIELGADAGGMQMLTTFVGRYPESVRALTARPDRWDAALYALAVGFALFDINLRENPQNAERIYYDAVIRHQICTDASELTVRSQFPEGIEEWREAERRAWLRYRGRFAALQAAALCGTFGGDGLSARYDVLSRSGSPELTATLTAARELHDRVAAALPELRGRRSSAEFDTGFDDSALHRDIETAPSTAIGASLLRRWQEAAAGAHLIGAAIVSTVVDLRVSGYGGPIAHDDVRELHRHYLPGALAAASDDDYEAELSWAYGRIGGVAGCISWVNGSFGADHALITVVRELAHFRQVPRPVRRWAIKRTKDPDDLLVLAARAMWERDLDIAEKALEKAAPHRPETVTDLRGSLAELRGGTAEGIAWREGSTRLDDGAGLNRLGLLYLRAGHLDKAEALFRPLSATGSPAALCNMGLLEERRGRMESAKRWWEQAAAGGDVRAMNNLGKIAYTEGNQAAAKRWFGSAADAGDLLGQYNLGVMADEGGDPADAETWWRIAADSGSTDAMVDLGHLLRAQGRAEEAADWWRSCAEVAGQQLAADPVLRTERLSLGESMKQWDDRLDDAQEPSSLRNYGILLAMSGDVPAALTQLARARDSGDAEAADLHHRISATLLRRKRRWFSFRRHR